MNIFFNKPYYGKSSTKFVEETFLNNNLILKKSYTEKSIAWFRNEFEFENIVLTSSCSSALFAIALTLSERYSGTIVVPSFTFTTSASVFESVGFKIEYADIDPETLCLNVNHLDDLQINDLVAVVNVNYAGYVRNHIQLREWCSKKNVFMIEDAAHGFDGKFNSSTAALSDFAAFSFHTTKNISCGEGGALVVNNKKFHDGILFAVNKGTNRHNYLEGKIDKYEWISRGSNFLLSEIQSAVLYASLIEFREIMEIRKNIWHIYDNSLRATFEENGWLVNPCPIGDERLTYHIFFAVAPNSEDRQKFLEYTNGKGIPTQAHYPALHRSPFGKKFHSRALPITENISETIVRLPLHNMISMEELEVICHVILNYFNLASKK